MHQLSVGGMPSAAGVAYPRRGVVDLDLPPKQRWMGLMSTLRVEMLKHMKTWRSVIGHHSWEVDLPAWSKAIEASLARPEYRQELEGIYEVLDGSDSPKSAVTWDSLMAFQAMYEIGSPMGCSELLAAAPDGTVLHGRNLDYKVVSPVIEVEFRRGGEAAYVAPVYLGHVGLHTVLKKGFFSFGQNTRAYSGDDGPKVALQRLQSNGRLFGDFVRNMVDDDSVRYSEAVQQLRGVSLLRGSYFIIAGPGPYEGTVLTRAADPSFKKEDTLSPKRWYLFQFNTDMDKPLTIDPRPAVGRMVMRGMSQNMVSPEFVRTKMRDFLIYTPLNVVLFMMSPKSGAHCSVLGPFVFNDDRRVDTDVCALKGWDPQYER